MGTRHAGNPEEVLALDTFIKLARASEAVARLLRPHFDKLKLTPSQFGVLEALYHLGPMCQKELGLKILKSGGNMTLVIDNLVQSGLVARQVNATSRRTNRISLTASGKKMIEKIFPEHARTVAGIMSRLTDAEQRTLQKLLRKLGGAAK